jgi:hypothetical protein
MHVINVINLTFDATLVYKIFYKFISSGKDTGNVQNIRISNAALSREVTSP